MPTNISNAIGTARQFTPQPDAGYMGKYHGINLSYAKASYDTSLGDNIARLNSALQSYMVNHEKMLDATGYENAQRMLNRATPEDIEKLGVIDAAQAYGFVDDTANPYFRAYADKLRGSFLASKTKVEYDDRYSMTPAKNMDEEAKRYAQFAKDRRDTYRLTATNQYAFDNGFTEGNLVNINKLWSDHQQKRRQEDILIALSETQGKLGDITATTPALKAEANGSMARVIEEAQTVWNTPRLMGLPIEHRKKLLEDWAKELIQTGHLGKEDFTALMEALTIQTRMDGTEVKANTLLNMQTYATMAAEYNRQYLTKELRDTISDYIKREDADGWLAMVEETRENNPDYAPTYEQYTKYVLNHIEEAQKSRARAAERQLREALKAKEQADKVAIAHDYVVRAINSWMNLGDSVDGIFIKSLPVKADDVRGPLMEALQKQITDDNLDGVIRLMAIPLPGANEVRDTIKADMREKLNAITPALLENPARKASFNDMLLFCAANVNAMEGLFGEDVAKAARVLKLLTDLSGDFDIGLSQFAVWNTTPMDTRRAYKAQVEGQIDNLQYTIPEMPLLDGGRTDFSVFDNPDIEGDIATCATALCCQGYTAEMAVSIAGAKVKENFFLFRGAAIPAGCLTGIRVPNPRLSLAKALEEWAGDYPYCCYKRQTQEFLFGENPPLKLSDAQENAMIWWENEQAAQMERAAQADVSEETTLTAAEINQTNRARMVPTTVEEAYEYID